MDIHDIRQQLRTKSLYDIPLRVTYYARVSSESDEQLNSLGNQIQYYEDFIRRNAAWTFVPGYIDEGLSGISTKRRENFNRMIDDAADDTFDLIITKEISRFARNTLDSIQFTRQDVYKRQIAKKLFFCELPKQMPHKRCTEDFYQCASAILISSAAIKHL